MAFRSGRHFLQIPGPTNVPDRILRAIAQPTIDHRSADFAVLTREVLAGLQWVFKSSGPVIVYPSSATGAWEAAFVNTLSPGDKVLSFEIGEFARLWGDMATKLGLDVEVVDTDWRHGVDPAVVEEKLTADRGHRIKAVLVVHNETSTGATSRLGEIRQAIDRAKHPALYFVDAVSSLGSIDLRQDEWGIDVTVAGSQKGLMLPPGMSFNAISAKALEASTRASLTKVYWAWGPMLAFNEQGFFTYTPSTNLLYGLREALHMLREEGLEQVFARHQRLAAATRAAVRGWGLEVLACRDDEQSASVTTVVASGWPGVVSGAGPAVASGAGPAVASGFRRTSENAFDTDAFRKLVLDRFNLSLGTGLGRLKGRAFRIGHLGDFNELMLMGTLCGIEMGLEAAGVPHRPGGVDAAMKSLLQEPS